MATLINDKHYFRTVFDVILHKSYYLTSGLVAKWFQCIKVYVLQLKWKVAALCCKSKLNLLWDRRIYLKFVTLIQTFLFHSIMFCYHFVVNNIQCKMDKMNFLN